MLWVALGEAVQAQAQLILFGAKLDRAVAERAVGLQVGRLLKFDFDAFGSQRDATDAGQLGKPAGNDRIHDEAVVGVIRADGIEP
ncbi:hypothetical protein D3C78_1449860 [compost metagenome]